jgi:phage head maturation protease
VRRVYAVDLWEVSIVTFPLLSGARVASVKGTAQEPGAGRLSFARAAAERDWKAACAGRGPHA